MVPGNSLQQCSYTQAPVPVPVLVPVSVNARHISLTEGESRAEQRQQQRCTWRGGTAPGSQSHHPLAAV
jgi:hypothetical protein